ncbi:helix-turn-helix domain-containing protein [Fulvivirgaceae bacterium PWU5]|uniref:Helix-turn-helix domain-containing protein n=1 Tax=Dawidia cretensis TaxID=2782350 RepID=A0AAP2GWB0_9BACT|nr:helix-turn-helix transcriptional regulator [Dawidia cretensis]MBT1712035.1 helix-turn-helix domain-containing protein [Dawidia cretensis]
MATTDTSKPRTPNHGKNLKRFREMLGLKQEALADKLGEGRSQRKLSYLEGKETIEASEIEELAKALNLPAEAILNFDEEKAVYNIQNNYDHTTNPTHGLNYNATFNPLDKFVEAVQKNDELVAETKRLYEDLLKAEREKNALLERLLNDKSK